jgi:hypothetical protein
MLAVRPPAEPLIGEVLAQWRTDRSTTFADGAAPAGGAASALLMVLPGMVAATVGRFARFRRSSEGEKDSTSRRS